MRMASLAAETVVHTHMAAAFDFPATFSRGVFSCGNRALARMLARACPVRRPRFAVALDDGVAAAWPGLHVALDAYVRRHGLELAAPPRMIPGGWRAKAAPEVVAGLQAWLVGLGLDRRSCLVAVGGGAVLDACGYAAATLRGGVRLVRVPTTFAAQAEAGVLASPAIDAYGAADALAVFAPPFGVVNDVGWLATVPPRHLRAGLAVAVKAAMLADAGLFHWLASNAGGLARLDPAPLAVLARRSAEVYLRHVSTAGNPFAPGAAGPLDFGRWAARKLGALTGHALLDGEALAVGMALDTRLAVDAKLLDATTAVALTGVMQTLGLPLWHDSLALRDPSGRLLVLGGLDDWAEACGGPPGVMLPAGIGRGVRAGLPTAAAVEAAVAWLARAARRGER